MTAAARVGDMTSHGTPLGPGTGSQNVLIGGQPAWRAVADIHTCPLTDGPKAHFGGPVIFGSLTVLINGFGAARVGDTITEAGPPNTISVGMPTVIIGG